MTEIDPALRAPAGRLLPGGPARPAGQRALHDARRAAAARAAARDPRARRVAAAARRAARAGARASATPRATRHLDGFPSAELAEAQARSTRRSASRRPRTRTRSPASTRRAWRAPRRARAPLREAVAAAPLVLDAVADRRAAAQQAGMGTAEFEAFVSPGAVPRPRRTRSPPGASCATFQARADRAPAQRARDPHRGRRAPTSRCASRAARGSTPTASATCPRGEVFTGPHETSAEGRIRFTIPLAPARRRRRGRRARVPRRRGRRARAPSAATRYLQAALETDDGARCLGELGIGTNFGIDRPIGAILFDEKIGGTVHLALGRSYPETGGTNESRACTGT